MNTAFKKHSPVLRLTATLLIALMVLQGFAPAAWAKSPVKLKKWQGTIDLNAPGPVRPFTLSGEASHLGKFTAHGEVEFVPGTPRGTLVGEGPVVFEAANGDLLVGIVTWELDQESNGLRATSLHFSWNDSVEFSDGTILSSTGRFVDNRPPGLVVLAIIVTLTALLLPAIQKVR